MKKRIIIIMTFMLVFILTGCARINIEMNIKDNGKVDMSMLYAFIEAAAEGTDMLSDGDVEDLVEDGWEYAPYNQDGYVGYTLNVKDKDLKELIDEVEDSDGTLEMGESFSIKKEDGKYIFDCDLLGEEDLSSMSEYKEYFGMYGGYITVVLHVPEAALESNATSVTDDGKTLTWDLLEMKPGEKIHAEFKLSTFNGLPIPNINLSRGMGLGVVISCLVILVAVLVIVFVVIGSKKKKKAQQAASAAAAGGFAGDGYQANNVYQNSAPQAPQMNQPYAVPTMPQAPQMQAPPAAQTPPAMQAPSSQQAAAPQMKLSFCPQCGAKLGAPSAYCPQCGAKLS